MNAIFSFDLNEPEDKEKFEIYCKALEMDRKIDKFSEFLRRNWKHAELPSSAEELLEIIQQNFAEIFFGDD